MKSSKPTVLDLFCGAGGMSLGFQNAGCKILGGIDLNPYAIMTHNKNFPSCILQIAATDINQIKFEKIPLNSGDIDILIGGPPCQVFSRVGIGGMKSLGRDIESDPRNFLYKHFVRFVSYYKPLVFVMENVDHLARKRDILPKIVRDFSIPGYKVEYRVLDASEFGVPQVRKRLFIVGVRSDLNIEPPFPSRRSKYVVSVGDAISDLPELEPFVMPLRAKSSGPKQKDIERPYKAPPQSDYQAKMRKRKQEGEGVWNHLCRAHNEKDIMIFGMLDEGGKYRDLPEEMMRYRADIFDDKYRRLIWNKPSWALIAHMRKDGLAYIHPLQNRSISVREAARIQSFPDDFVFYAPMTRMFELVGNSVPPLLAEAVAKPIVKLVKQTKSQSSQEEP